MKKVKQYSLFECESESPLTLTSPSGRSILLEPFELLPIEFSYDDEGAEKVYSCGKSISIVRFFPDELGIYRFNGGEFECIEGESHGYVEISKNDPRYFSYSDGSRFYPIGINLAFITPYSKSNGDEFGYTGFKYLGMRQYERWFRDCHENGVNLVRIWIGHEYFSPDTEEAYVLDKIKLAKLEKLIELARKYELKLKLTLEQFRYFNYERTADSDSYADDVFRKFNKRLYMNGKRCESSSEWLMGEEWRKSWLFKVNELAKRFSGDPTVFGIELWNEMNCMPWDDMTEWNKYMLPKVKKLFPRQLVMNSLGSFDSDGVLDSYNKFVWELSDIKQMHRYLDQGAAYNICHEDPMALLRDGINILADPNKPFMVAETGAVNNCHSGPFRYYSADHNGMLFCDLVYTPLFCGSASCGHIWHWDSRYVESKNLYRYFRPLSILCEGVVFDCEDFHPEVYEDDEVILLLLRGKHTTLGYFRNKSYNWMNILRDLKPHTTVCEKNINIPLDGNSETINIWDGETAKIKYDGSSLKVSYLKYGILIKFIK